MIKFKHNGKSYNPGSYASEDVITAATNRFGRPDALFTPKFGGNYNLGTSSKIGNAFKMNPKSVLEFNTEYTIPYSSVLAPILEEAEDTPIKFEESRLVQRQPEESKKPEKSLSFNDAFAQARKSGKSVFT